MPGIMLNDIYKTVNKTYKFYVFMKPPILEKTETKKIITTKMNVKVDVIR